jgi:hypothetical protein
MKMPSWLKKTKNNAEAISSSSVHHGHRPPSPPPAVLLRQLPLAPRSEDYLTRPVRIIARPRRQRNRRYVPLKECEQLWEANQGIDQPDVSLPHDWHLNHARVSVPPMPDEDALLLQVLEASKANKDTRFPELQEALTLTRMVAEHLASLACPPPLPVHAPP